jgi:hypothetical protein
MVMPDHIHWNVVLPDGGGRALSEILRALKSFSTKWIDALNGTTR